MCGRINVSDDPLAQFIADALGIPFKTRSNPDLRPTDPIDVIADIEPVQLTLNWGIKPEWSKRLIINAQAESAAIKPTFRESFHFYRCLVPCAGWYEWSSSNSKGEKRKYQVSYADGKPCLMAGLILPDMKLVTMTTRPDKQYAHLHHRMPLLIPPANAKSWLTDRHYALELTQAEQQYKLHISLAN